MPNGVFQYALAIKAGDLKAQDVPEKIRSTAVRLSKDLNPEDFNAIASAPKRTGKPQPRSAIRKVRRA